MCSGATSELTDITTQNRLHLLLLEAALEDQRVAAVEGAAGAELGEQEAEYVVGLPVHHLADLDKVDESWGKEVTREREWPSVTPIRGEL